MPAPKGNKFWKARSSHGPNPKFTKPDDLWNACTEYFDWVENNPLVEVKGFAFQGKVTQEKLPKMRAMTIGGLCLFLGISESTWDNWRHHREDLSEIITRVEQVIYTQKFTGAAAELLNSNIIARELSLADKKDHTSSDGSMKPKTKVIDLSQITDEQLKAYKTIAALTEGGEGGD